MAELLSVRFSKIGYRDARLDGLSYDLATPEGSPENALIIGSNSSGKTSQLHLIFSIFLPHHNELVSQRDSFGRQFAYYFEENEIGFVATEWTIPGSGNLPGMTATETRVVGRFSQFTNRERNEQTTVFFSFIADSEFGIDDLPITSSIPHRVATSPKTVNEAKKYLREIFDDKPSKDFYLTENMKHWQDYLSKRFFNIEQFRLMMQFTMSEGDSSSFLKQFSNNEMVLKFLCHDVLDKNTTERLHGMLAQHRESVRLEPVTRAQLAAYSALSDRFSMMKPVADEYAAAVHHRHRVTELLKMVISRVVATLKSAENHLTSLEHVQATDKTELKCQQIELVDYEARFRGVKEQIAVLTHDEAQQTYQECNARLGTAKRLHLAMQALFGQVKVEQSRSRAEYLARQLDLLSEPLRSLTDEAAMARSLLHGFFSIELEQTQAEHNNQLAVVTEASNETKRLHDLLNEHVASQAGKSQEKASLEKDETARQTSVERLVAEKLLVENTSCPNAALSVVADSIANAEKERTTLENERSNQNASLVGYKEQLKSNRNNYDRLQSAVNAADNNFKKYTEEYAAISELSGIRTLFGQTEPDLFLPDLPGRLQERYEKEVSELSRLDAEIEKLAEQVAAIEEHCGLLPPARDVKRVIETLEMPGIVAYSWWQVFAERNIPVEEARKLVEAFPSRYGGVAVTSKRDLDRAQELLADGCGVLAPVIISVYTDNDNGAPYDGVVVFPDIGIAIDRKRSADFCQNNRREIETYRLSLPTISQSRDEALYAKDKIVGFLSRYDDSTRLALMDTAAFKRREFESNLRERAQLEEQCRKIESAFANLENGLAAIIQKLQRYRNDHESIKAHIDTHETGRAERVCRISELVEVLSSIESTIAKGRSMIVAAGERETTARDLAAKGDARCSYIRNELDQLTGEKKVPSEEFQTLAITSESARILLVAKERALDAASDDAEYIETKTLAKNAQTAHTEEAGKWREKFGKLAEEYIQEASNHIAGRQASEIDVETMQAAKEEAHIAESHAERSMKDAFKALQELKRVNSSQKVAPFSSDIETSLAQEISLSAGIDHSTKLIATLNEVINSRIVEIEICKGRVNLLSNLASQEDVECEPDVEPFATDMEAESVLKNARKAKKEAEEKAQQFYDKLKSLSNDLATLLDDELCAKIPQVVMNIKEELRRCERVLTEGIDTLAEYVQFAMAPLSHELETLEQKKNIVVTEVMHDVKKALALLSNLEKKSKIPPLGGIWHAWTNRPFVRFWTSVKMDSEQSRLAIASTVTRLAQTEGKLPSGAVIVQSALSELLGNAYRIETLKPDTSPSTNYVGIGHPEGLHSWSGGQKLSGSVLFYMAMCNLLSFEGQSGGILLMDNPFGACNHIEFVRLIVALTRQYGIQMIAYTPTEDMEIRRLYPINVLIRKGGTAGIVKRTGHTLVQQDKTIYNGGETTTLVINSEAPHAS
jgi:hypothetical protein